VTAQSAPPVNVIGTNALLPNGGYYSLRPNVVPGEPLYLFGSQYPGAKAFNPAAFQVVTTEQGDLGRNVLRGFDLVQADLSARRSLILTERIHLLFRADFFNILNHPNFASPYPDIGSLFGVSSAMADSYIGGGSGSYGLNALFQSGGPRSIQLSLKLQF
jgi:hypothetical protein